MTEFAFAMANLQFNAYKSMIMGYYSAIWKVPMIFSPAAKANHIRHHWEYTEGALLKFSIMSQIPCSIK